MAFSDFIALADSYKVFLCEINIGDEIHDKTWVQHGVQTNCWYITYPPTDDDEYIEEGAVNGVEEDGEPYDEYYSLADLNANAGSFFYDLFNQILYVHTTGSDDPGGNDAGTPPVYDYCIIAYVWQYFTNAQYKDDEIVHKRQCEKLLDGNLDLWDNANELKYWGESIAGGTTTINKDTDDYADEDESAFSCRIDVDATPNYGYIYQDIYLKPKAGCKLKFWYMTTAGDTARLRVRDSAGNVYLQSDGSWAAAQNITLPESTTWTEYEIEFNAHEDYTYYRVELWAYSASGSVWYDMASLIMYEEDNYYRPLLDTQSMPDIVQSVGDYYSESIQMQFGKIYLFNSGWLYQMLQEYIWHNKEFRLLLGRKGTDYEDYEIVFIGNTRQPIAADTKIEIGCTDRKKVTFKSIPLNDFNQADYPGGVLGGRVYHIEDGAHGKVVPLLWGEKENITCVKLADAIGCRFHITVGGGNEYDYQDLSGVTDYVVQADDCLEYWQYWENEKSYIFVDLWNSNDAEWLSATAAVDQNGIIPEGDTSAYSEGMWYHRRIDLPASWVGDTIELYCLCVWENPATAEYKTGMITDINITDGGSPAAVTKAIWNKGTDDGTDPTVVQDQTTTNCHVEAVLDVDHFKFADHLVEDILKCYQEGEQWGTELTEDTTTWANDWYSLDEWGEFIAFGITDGQSLITCNAQGRLCDIIDGTYSTNVADFLYDLLVNFNGVSDLDIHMASFIDLKNSRTQDHCIYVNSATASYDIVRKYQTSALFHLIPRLDGKFGAYRYTTGTDATTPRINDDDIGKDSFSLVYQTKSIYQNVRVKYDRNPSTGIHKSVLITADDADYKYDETDTLPIFTTLKEEADAQNLCDFYLDLFKNPQRKVTAEIPAVGFNMRPAEKIIMTKSRLGDDGNTIYVLNEEAQRVLQLEKSLKNKKVKITSLEDLQSAGETYCETCVDCEACVLAEGSCLNCYTCQKCDTGQCDSCQVCYYCENCDTGECCSCQLCDTCQTCYTCEALECSACVACELCVLCQKCDVCQESQCGSCQVCNTCQSCNKCQLCDSGQCVSCENCDTCQSCFSGECASCQNCDVCQDCVACEVCYHVCEIFEA